AHGLFEVSGEGVYTYYFLAKDVDHDIGNTIQAADIQLSLIYFPTAYGTIFTEAFIPVSEVGYEDIDTNRKEPVINSSLSDTHVEDEFFAMKNRLEYLEEKVRQLEKNAEK
ncbi:MAG: hypothetical protein JXA92_09430, partial [candidate division Zixibacteria bacterium]|nr:hypothetical protein [candidate division Zixibacteria bacterium]